MAWTGHEDQFPHIRAGLGGHNLLINLYGGTYQSASTTIAGWQGVNTGKQADAALTHEDQKMLVRRLNAYTGLNLSAPSPAIYGNTEVAASNTTATWRQQFTDKDGSLPAAYFNGMGDD